MGNGPKKIIIACDESGAKGYSDQKEKHDGEVGVIAGILFDTEQEKIIRPVFKGVYDQFKLSSGKLHIAELDPGHQQDLRTAVFDLVQKHDLKCFWQAIHVEGFANQPLGHLKAPSTGSSRYSFGSPRKPKESMHVKLLECLYCSVSRFLDEKNLGKVELEFRPDTIDKPILKKFEAAAKRLTYVGPETTPIKAFDNAEKKVVQGEVKFEGLGEVEFEELALDLEPPKLTVRPHVADDPFVLVADVIVGSLYYHFKNRPDEEKYKPLNVISAVKNHPLQKNFDVFQDGDELDWYTENFYRHPKAQW